MCAEETGLKYGIGREQQDAYGIESYRCAALATEVSSNDREIGGYYILLSIVRVFL